MSIFDLAFLLFALGTLGGVAFFLFQLATRRLARARVVGLTLVAAWLVYFSALVSTSLATGPRMLDLGQDRCYDDWCIAAVEVGRAAVGSQQILTITFQMTNEARRVAQRENGFGVFVIDAAGYRLVPDVDAAEPAFDQRLEPGEVVQTQRTFTVPVGAGELWLGYEHTGWNALPGVLVIGDDSSWLHRPTLVRLPAGD